MRQMRTLTTIAVTSVMPLAACQNVSNAPESDSVTPDEIAAHIGWPSNTVAESGDITLPDGFETWPTLGSWSTADADGVQNGMHQVYASPGTIEGFKQNGSFPDGSVLVKEVRGAATANLSTGAASYATKKQVWFVMVKDTQGRFANNALWGDGWGWALFEAADPAKQVATDYKVDCQGCHIPAQETDWIYTAAYPVLWPNGSTSQPSWQD